MRGLVARPSYPLASNPDPSVSTNSPVAGLRPHITAGLPSHLAVVVCGFSVACCTISIASAMPCVPRRNTRSSRCSMPLALPPTPASSASTKATYPRLIIRSRSRARKFTSLSATVVGSCMPSRARYSWKSFNLASRSGSCAIAA